MPQYLQPTASFWDPWLLEHGRDSQEEKMFLGYLTTNSILPSATVAELNDAYTAFEAYLAASQE